MCLDKNNLVTNNTEEGNCGSFGICVENIISDPPLVCLCDNGWEQNFEFIFVDENKVSKTQLPCNSNVIALKVLYGIGLLLSVLTVLFNARHVSRKSQFIRLLPLFVGFTLQGAFCVLRLVCFDCGFGTNDAFSSLWLAAFTLGNVMGLIFINRYVHYQNKLITNYKGESFMSSRKVPKRVFHSIVRKMTRNGSRVQNSSVQSQPVSEKFPAEHKVALLFGSRRLQLIIVIFCLLASSLLTVSAFYDKQGVHENSHNVRKYIFVAGIALSSMFYIICALSCFVLIGNLIQNTQSIISNGGLLPVKNGRKKSRKDIEEKESEINDSKSAYHSTAGLNNTRLRVLHKSVPRLKIVHRLTVGMCIVAALLFLIPLLGSESLFLWKYCIPINVILGNFMTLGVLYWFLKIRGLSKKVARSVTTGKDNFSQNQQTYNWSHSSQY